MPSKAKAAVKRTAVYDTAPSQNEALAGTDTKLEFRVPGALLERWQEVCRTVIQREKMAVSRQEAVANGQVLEVLLRNLVLEVV